MHVLDAEDYRIVFLPKGSLDEISPITRRLCSQLDTWATSQINGQGHQLPQKVLWQLCCEVIDNK